MEKVGVVDCTMTDCGRALVGVDTIMRDDARRDERRLARLISEWVEDTNDPSEVLEDEDESSESFDCEGCIKVAGSWTEILFNAFGRSGEQATTTELFLFPAPESVGEDLLNNIERRLVEVEMKLDLRAEELPNETESREPEPYRVDVDAEGFGNLSSPIKLESLETELITIALLNLLVAIGRVGKGGGGSSTLHR